MRKALVDDVNQQIKAGVKYPQITNGLGHAYYVTGYSKEGIIFYAKVDPAIFSEKPRNDQETNHQLKTAMRDLKQAVYDFSKIVEKESVEARPDEFNAYAENYFGAHPTLRDALFPLLVETRLERESQPIKECMQNRLSVAIPK